MDQKRTKWRLDGHAWVISKIKECSDLDEMLEMMPTKFKRKRTWGKYLTRNNKHYVQNEWDFWTIRIRIRKRRILEMQSCHNDVRAMTPCFYVSNEGATLGLSRAICKKSVASVIVEIVRAKERSPKRPETEKMVPGRSRVRVSGERRIQWPWRNARDYAYEFWRELE